MPDINERIIQLAKKLYGEGEYTVHVSELEAELRDATGRTLYRATDMRTKPVHVAVLLRHLRRKAGDHA